MSQAHREAISRGQIERHRRQRAERVAAPDQKRCTQCGKWKRVPEDYNMRKRTLKSGETTTYPAGECNDCANKRKLAWKQKFIEKHGYEAWRERERQYAKTRDKEKQRRYNREYQRLVHGYKTVWAKYEDELKERKIEVIDGQTFLDFWRSVPEPRRFEALHPGGEPDEATIRALYRVEHEGQKNLSLEIVDRIGVRLGYPGLDRRLQ